MTDEIIKTNPLSKKAIIVAIATALAMPFEGLRQYAYYDPPGILTVCYGTTTDVIKNKKYSLEECKALLNKDMLDAVESVDRCKGKSVLSDKTHAALADAVYNIGPKLTCNISASTLARKLQSGDIAGACNELPKWDKARVGGNLIALPGLTKRRAAEKQLCLEGLS